MKYISIYDIYYAIDLETLTFSGLETIRGETESDLWMNLSGIDISSIKLNGEDVKYSVIPSEEILKIDQEFKGNFELEIKFSGKLSESLSGVYYSKEKNGYFISSHFEATGARYAIPCLDNPAFKAVFRLTLDIQEDYDGISNMPPISIETHNGRKVIHFEETPRMSTYLLYIGAGKYDILEGKHKDKPVYLVASKGKFELSELPITMATETIDYFEKYFEIEYKLPKLHLIAVPDFAFGAMENWGAITFREIRLVIGKNTSLSVMKMVDEVISHELAHQWFGDLVTMKWWDDIWLNESFATFMSYKAVDRKHPEWEIMSELVTDETGGAMRGDSLRNTHPIHVDVKNPEDIEQIFDEISYGKGASILRMIEGYVGEENFRNGVKKYLIAHEFSNAEGHELWESVEKVSGKPVSKIMESWVNQQGYPLIETTLDGNTIHLKQSRFVLDGSSDDTLWPIPLTVKYSGVVETYLMKGETIDIPSKNFICLNPERTGFYRTKYDEKTWEIVRGNIEYSDSFVRWGIISDSLALYLSGNVPLKKMLEILIEFKTDASFIVMDEITRITVQLHTILNNSKVVDDFSIDYLSTHLNRLGEKTDNESINQTVIRGRMQTALSIVDMSYAMKASQNFETLFAHSPESRLSIAIAFARTTNNLAKLKEMYNKATVDEDRVKILNAMGHLTGDEIMSETWNFVTSGQVKKQDMFALIGSALTETENRPYLCNNIEKIVTTLDKFFSGTGSVSKFLEILIPLAGLHDELTITNFISKSSKTAWQNGIKKGLEYLNIYKNVNKIQVRMQ